MKALWVDAGNDPWYAGCEALGVTHLYFALNDPRVSKSYLQNVAAKGYGVGVYVVAGHPLWPEFQGNGRQFAEKVSAKVGPLFISTASPKVQLDMEMHDPEFILTALERWRELRPKQDTSWTLESFQGGWMTPEFVKRVIALKIRVVPQFYGGDMTPFAQDRSLKDLLDRGFPSSLITGCYDAASLPEYWDGFAFTQGRLPR